MRIEGLDEVLKQLGRTRDEVVTATRGALYVEGEQTITEAKRLTPVDEGILRASGFVQLPVETPEGIEVMIGFGGPAGTGNRGETNTEDVGYAVYVHEDLTAHHTVGQAKFLETPINRRRPEFTARIVQRIRRRLQLS